MARGGYDLVRRQNKEGMTGYIVVAVQLLTWGTAGGLLIYRGATTLVEKTSGTDNNSFRNRSYDMHLQTPVSTTHESVNKSAQEHVKNISESRANLKHISELYNKNHLRELRSHNILSDQHYKETVFNKTRDLNKVSLNFPSEVVSREDHKSGFLNKSMNVSEVSLDKTFETNVTGVFMDITSVKVSPSALLLVAVGVMMLLIGCTVLFFRQRDLERRREYFQKISHDERLTEEEPPPSYADATAPPRYSTLCLNEESCAHLEPD